MNEPLLVSTAQLQKILGGVCYRTAVRIGEEAGAKIMIGRSPRWYRDRIEEYLVSKLEERQK